MVDVKDPLLLEVFRDVLGDDDLSLDREATADDIDGWDSLAHINLIIALEAAFGVRFSTAETSILKQEGQNVGSFVDLLAQKVADKA